MKHGPNRTFASPTCCNGGLMYAAIAKNGEPINGIKAGIQASLSLCLVLIAWRNEEDTTTTTTTFATGSGCDMNRRFHDGAKSFRNLARRQSPSSNRARRASGRVTNDSGTSRGSNADEESSELAERNITSHEMIELFEAK
ncbi:uncharacterized protein LOC109611098 [Ooceraea biroi]|uniref:uncharacterized protein LOC109611098 n=1 Tax=Ooceraea biroi TaxID=2015173 RepID=UPI00097168F6|nr:uncharacterized protein LOC109611098 [Ooceraea biroi]